jgi:hypothetical protein
MEKEGESGGGLAGMAGVTSVCIELCSLETHPQSTYPHLGMTVEGCESILDVTGLI